MQVRCGLDQCTAETPRQLRGARFGLLMNQASVSWDFRYADEVLAQLFPGQLRAIFAPQHGLYCQQQANMVESPHERHWRLDIPVYSLYSETRRPTAEMLSDLDCLVVDLQDVGCRVYTFIWTVTYCLEACAAARIPVLVLDRPNPIGGVEVEGPLLDGNFRSFVGRAEIPMRHALTIGELALLLNQKMAIGAELHILGLRDWKREMRFPETGGHWIPPSPNMPTWLAALVYPGQVLLEGTNLSEGRGTTTPFQIVGAPFIDPETLLRMIRPYQLAGVALLPVRFCPTFDKWAGCSCGGLSLHITDALSFQPYRTTLAILGCIRQRWPDQFAWTPPPYEYETEKMPIDILSGGAALRERLDRGSPLSSEELDELSDTERGCGAGWSATAQTYHLYH